LTLLNNVIYVSCLRCSFCVGLAIKDEPFGLHLHSSGDNDSPGWDSIDKIPTEQQRTSFMQCLQLYNDPASPTVFFTYCQPYQMQAVKECMEAFGYIHGHPMYFYKVGQNAGGLKQFIYAVDTGFIAYRPSRDKVAWLGPANPLQRHNIIFVPNMKDKRLTSSDGKTVNRTEKHPLCTRALCARFCKKGDWVLVAGSGAGGDVEGALGAGCNVVAIEKDSFQFQHCNDRVFRLFNDEVDKIANLPPLFTKADDDEDYGHNMMGLSSHFGQARVDASHASDDEEVAMELDFSAAVDNKVHSCGECLDTYSGTDAKACGYGDCGTVVHLNDDCIKAACKSCNSVFCSANHEQLHLCPKAIEQAIQPDKTAPSGPPKPPTGPPKPPKPATYSGSEFPHASTGNVKMLKK
jgi:hypothetical protein